MAKLPKQRVKRTSNSKKLHHGYALLIGLLFSLLIFNGLARAAAVPTATLAVPTEGFVGEAISFTVTFDNTAAGGTETGYGPYIDLILPAIGVDGAGAATDDGITFGSATYLGTPVVSTVLTFNGAGQATHPYAKDVSGNPLVITGTPGNQLVVLQLPYGSFTRDQPAATIQINANLSNLADVGTALNIQARAGFQFGNDPLDNPITDPSITGNLATSPFTPTLFTLSKTYIGPEDETATGPNYPRQYRVTVDIANGQTLTNLDLTDVLPNNMQFVAVDSTTIRGTATATTASSTPSTTVPGGTLTRRFASVTGTTAGNDAEMLFTFFIPLNNTTPTRVINATSGDDVTSINDARTAGNWAPIDTRDGGSRAVSSNITANDHTLEDKSIAIQKGVARVVDVNPTGNTPGDTLEYTLQFQVSDFFAFQSLVIDDTFTDGQRWDNSFTPQLAVNGNGFTLAAANIAAANFTLTPNYTPASPAPNDGTSNVIFRVSDEIIRRGQSGKMIGGCIPVAGTGGPAPSCASFNDGATTATVTFRTVIQDKYSDTFPSGDPSLNEGDGLSNTASVSGSLLSETNTNNTTGQSEADGSSAGVSIAQGALVKSVYKINGADPVSSPPQMAPGDLVTYRLRYDLILGDFEQLSFTDYLPLPVFDVNDPDDNNVAGPAWSFDNTGALVPPPGQWKRGPADTQFARSGIVPTTSIDTAANFLRFAYGTFDDPANQAATIDLLFTVTVSDDPFADSLFLTNQVRESDQDTNGNATTRDALVQIQLTEPVLAITKGVVATDGTVATFSPATVGPVAFTAPGSGCPRFSGTISSTGLTATPINSNLTGIDAGDRVTFAIVVQNTGTGLRGAFDIRVKDTLPTGFAVPGGGLNLCVRGGTGAAISTTNVGGGTGLLDQGIELTDPGPTATPAGALDPFNASSGRNIAIITFDLLAQTAVVPASTIQNTAPP